MTLFAFLYQLFEFNNNCNFTVEYSIETTDDGIDNEKSTSENSDNSINKTLKSEPTSRQV